MSIFTQGEILPSGAVLSSLPQIERAQFLVSAILHRLSLSLLSTAALAPCSRANALRSTQVLAQGHSKKRKSPAPQRPSSAAAATGSDRAVEAPPAKPPPAPILPRTGGKQQAEPTAAEQALKDILADLDGAPVAAAEPVVLHVASLVQRRLEAAPERLSVDGAIAAAETAAMPPSRKPRRSRKSTAAAPAAANAVEPAADQVAEAASQPPAKRSKGGRTWAKAVWERPEVQQLPLPPPLEALDGLFAEVAVHAAALCAHRLTVTASGLAEALRWTKRGLGVRQTLTHLVRVVHILTALAEVACSPSKRLNRFPLAAAGDALSGRPLLASRLHHQLPSLEGPSADGSPRRPGRGFRPASCWRSWRVHVSRRRRQFSRRARRGRWPVHGHGHRAPRPPTGARH